VGRGFKTMYAMVEIKGKQYKAVKDGLLTVDLLAEEKGAKVSFDSVLLYRGEKDVKIGAPYVKGAKVSAVVQDHIKGDKIVVYKYKRRKDYQRKQGHRQNYTLIRVQDLSLKA
jgi:large subunit ribosomal protein L21